MKLGTIFRVAIVTSVILLCAGLAIFFYLRLNVKVRAEDFDLYTVVPPDTRLVVDTENVVDLMQRINALDCSRDHHFLYFSLFFSDLKEHINGFVDQTPHGLSKQMSRMLISFHDPESNDRNQVFYCRLGAGDEKFIEDLIRKYSSDTFPARSFNYRGEDIRIYPMPGDQFLACYVNRDFLALSYQKRLVERVIDTYLSGKSLLAADAGFAKVRDRHRMLTPATIYARLNMIRMGANNDTLPKRSCIGDWTEFNVNMSHDVINLTGINYDTDTCRTFINAIRGQEPVNDFHGQIFPESAFYYATVSISDPQKILAFISPPNDTLPGDAGYPSAADAASLRLLKDYAGSTMTTYMLRSEEPLPDNPRIIACIPLKAPSPDVIRALHTLYDPVPYSRNLFVLPPNTLLARLSGLIDPASEARLMLYKDCLLIGLNVESLQVYTAIAGKKATAHNETPAYFDEMTPLLSPSYTFMMMADMGQVLEQPNDYVRFIPHLFFRYSDFFRHFILSAQFTSDDGVVYPTLVLTYKDIGE